MLRRKKRDKLYWKKTKTDELRRARKNKKEKNKSLDLLSDADSKSSIYSQVRPEFDQYFKSSDHNERN